MFFRSCDANTAEKNVMLMRTYGLSSGEFEYFLFSFNDGGKKGKKLKGSPYKAPK